MSKYAAIALEQIKSAEQIKLDETAQRTALVAIGFALVAIAEEMHGARTALESIDNWQRSGE